jgi:hypothetical protein
MTAAEFAKAVAKMVTRRESWELGDPMDDSTAAAVLEAMIMTARECVEVDYDQATAGNRDG